MRVAAARAGGVEAEVIPEVGMSLYESATGKPRLSIHSSTGKYADRLRLSPPENQGATISTGRCDE
jgi:hypothetical protein